MSYFLYCFGTMVQWFMQMKLHSSMIIRIFAVAIDRQIIAWLLYHKIGNEQIWIHTQIHRYLWICTNYTKK